MSKKEELETLSNIHDRIKSLVKQYNKIVELSDDTELTTLSVHFDEEDEDDDDDDEWESSEEGWENSGCSY